MRKLFFAATAAGLALANCSAAFGQDHRGDKCATMMEGRGESIPVAKSVSDEERVSISSAIYQALRGPDGRGPWSEAQLKAASPCALGSFDAGGTTYMLSGGGGALPSRSAQSTTNDVVFFLAEGRDGEPPFRKGLKGRPFFLISFADQQQFVLTAYDGAPSDATLQADIAASFQRDFTPLASFDPEGGAVSLYRNTSSGIGAQLFGAVPNPAHPATIYLPDGRYFVPDRKLDARMRGSNLPCPLDLGDVGLRRMFVIDGDDRTLDLGCQYQAAGAVVTLFVSRSDNTPLGDVFRDSIADARSHSPPVQPSEGLTAVGGKGQFALSENWRTDSNVDGGIWLGERNGYRIEVRADWKPEAARPVRLAIGIIQSLAFEKDPFGK